MPGGATQLKGAPDVKQERPVLGGEAGDGMRADNPARQRVSDLDFVETRRDTHAIGFQPLAAQPVDFFQLGLRPALDVPELVFEHAAFGGFFVQVSDGGRTLARHQGAVLIGVDGVPTRKHRRAGEFRLRHLVVVESALLEQSVPGPNRAAVEPPLLATEDQVAVRNVPNARGRGTVPVIQCHRNGLRRDEAAELGVAGELLVPVQRVGIVHRHHPAPNVGRTARLPQLPATDRFADAMVDVGQIEFDAVCFHGLRCHLLSPISDSRRRRCDRALCRPSVDPRRRSRRQERSLRRSNQALLDPGR